MKVAIVCDWLTNVGGAEKVLLRFHELYPKAPIYTSKYSPKGISWFDDADVRTGWMQIFPAKLRRVLGPLRQFYFSHLDLSEYDLIISVTGAEAKSVKSGKRLHEKGKKSKNPKGIHISYCHVPTQYYWQMYDSYLKDPGFGMLNGVVRCFFRLLVKPLRRADYKAAQNPDYFVTISNYAKDSIRKYYDREATVVHPPVEIEDFKQGNKVRKSQEEEIDKLNNKIIKSQGKGNNKSGNSFAKSQDGDYSQAVENFDIAKSYIVTSRQVNWKRLDLAVGACLKLGRPLLVVGEGPEHNKLVKMAGDSGLIRFLPLTDKKNLALLLQNAKGYLFPSLEPFGIAPVEALAAGCPVIAFSEGGAKDYLVDGENGVLFKEQTIDSLSQAISEFEKMKFERARIVESAEGFSMKRFDKEILDYVKEKLK